MAVRAAVRRLSSKLRRQICNPLLISVIPLLNGCRFLFVLSHSLLGELVAGDRESYRYLVESIRRFPPQDKFASMMAYAGFHIIEYENLVGGVIVIHSGLKL